MPNTHSQSFLRKHLDSIIAGVLGFLVLLFITKGKVDLTTDSIVYIHAARSIFCCHEFTQVNGSPLVDFPFFYPFFLGLVQFLTHIDIVRAGPYLNALLFGLLLFFSGYLLGLIRPENRIYKWVTLLLILCSPSLLQVYKALWSETLFIIEVLVFLILFYKYSRHHSIKSLTWVILITAVACITRYAAISLIISGSLLLLLDKELAWRKKLIHGTLFTIGGISLMAINMIRNYLVQDTASGVRQKGITSFSTNLEYYGKVIAGWLPGMKSQSGLFLGIAIIVIISLLIIFSIQYKRSVYSITGILAFFILSYSLFFLTISTLLNFEQIDNRFLSPFYIPFLIVYTSWIPAINRSLIMGRKWKSIVIIAFYILLFTGAIPGNPLLQANTNSTPRTNYSDPSWQYSDIVRFLKTHKNDFRKDHSFYSNSNEALYLFAGIPSDRLPQKINKPEISDFLDQDSIYIVWFNKVKNEDEISDTFFLQNKSLKPLQKFKDGAVYISVEDDDQ